LQGVVVGHRRLDCAGGCQRGLGLGEGDEFGLPPRSQRPRHEPVVRFDLAEGTFGAVGLIPGAFDGQFGDPGLRTCRSITSSAAARATRICCGVTVFSNNVATVSSTVSAVTVRQRVVGSAHL
jgi:hypothetical protein